MTRKHFQAIAEVMAETQPSQPPKDYDDWSSEQHLAHSFCVRQWEQTVRLMADMCQGFNPLFDRSQFIDACEA